jgi:N-acylneuraminate cytidylyltransferase
VVLLQPTAPFTRPGDIEACVAGVRDSNANCCFTAIRVSQQPHWMFVPQPDGTVELLMPGALSGHRQHTQMLPRYLHPSGAVWAVRTSAFRSSGRIYDAPMRTVEVEHARAVDIDTELDLVIAESVARHFGFAPVPAPGKAAAQS